MIQPNPGINTTQVTFSVHSQASLDGAFLALGTPSQSLGDDVMDHTTVNVRQPEIATTVAIG